MPPSRDQTNEVIPANDESTSTVVAATTTESSTTSSSRRGFKKLQTTDESSTVAGTAVKNYRRGNKTFGNGKATAEREESDNYPPEFKARLTQLVSFISLIGLMVELRLPFTEETLNELAILTLDVQWITEVVETKRNLGLLPIAGRFRCFVIFKILKNRQC